MASFAIWKNHKSIRVSASGAPPARSPLLSPRCLSPARPAAAHKHALTDLSAAAYKTGTAELPARASVSPNPGSTRRRSSGFDDCYDSAVPMSVLSGWERVNEDLGLDEAPGADPQEWEEMVSLLSFDGEEHKKVTRQVHGANARVEDMFASFDGDGFEAVLRAARNELPSETASNGTSAQPMQPPHSASRSSSSLYESVCALRAAAVAAEAAKKQQGPAVKKRRAPLGGPNAADAWMLQVPYSSADHPAQAAIAAAAAGSAAGASGDGAILNAAQVRQDRDGQRYSLHASKQALGAELQLHPLMFIGMSCDSSSDGSCSSSRDGESLPAKTVTAAPEAGAKGAGRQHQPSCAGTSNNIVSSRALGTRFTPASATTAVAASRVTPGCGPTGVATAAAVLEAAPAAAPAVSAAVQALQSPRAAVQTAAEGVAHMSVQQKLGAVSEQAAAAAYLMGGGQQRWSNRSTNSLRRALARLHHVQAR